MKLFKYMKDGGSLSRAAGLFLIEAKRWFSIVLLHFSDGSREAYHTHAFNAVSWVLWGKLIECNLDGTGAVYTPSLWPIYTPRARFHKVLSAGDTWVLSFRGPWVPQWREYLPEEEGHITFTHGRRIVNNAASAI